MRSMLLESTSDLRAPKSRSIYITGRTLVWLSLVGAGACSPPPSVRAVDEWLSAYAEGDIDRMVENTTPADRARVRSAMAALERSATSSLALTLPPRPLSHELVEIEKKSDNGRRHVVLCRVTYKNPLPYMSEKVGQDLPIPKTRTRRRRFLSVRQDGRWGVKLDLDRVVRRADFVERFQTALRRRDYSAAEAMLQAVPAPPDEANAQRTKDRLATTLREQFEAAKKGTRTSTKAAEVTRDEAVPPKRRTLGTPDPGAP